MGSFKIDQHNRNLCGFSSYQTGFYLSDIIMTTRPKPRRSSSRVDHQSVYDKALSYELSDLVYVNDKFKKFLELKGIQFRVRYIWSNYFLPVLFF